MTKYIDAERLRKAVRRLEKAAHKSALGCADSETRRFHEGKDFAYQYVGALIASLQQEQPEVDLEKEIDIAMKSDLCPEEICDYDFCCIAHFPWPTKWSKEDENTINELCNIIASNSKNGYLGRHYAGDLIQKLKSLRPQPKQEWSEEDIEKMVNKRARKSGTTKTEMQFYRQGIKDALKTIRQQRFGEI